MELKFICIKKGSTDGTHEASPQETIGEWVSAGGRELCWISSEGSTKQSQYGHLVRLKLGNKSLSIVVLFPSQNASFIETFTFDKLK